MVFVITDIPQEKVSSLLKLGIKYGYRLGSKIDTEIDETWKIIKRLEFHPNYNDLLNNKVMWNVSSPNLGEKVEKFDYDKLDICKLIEFLEGYKEIRIPISSNYTAVITKDGIQVGCQNISFETLDKIMKARKEVTQ